MDWCKIEELCGEVVLKIDHTENADGNESLVFHLSNGDKVEMSHVQDCCEDVWLEDVDGELEDLIGDVLIEAEETSQEGDESDFGYTTTWTYYKLGTNKGYVSLRWCGSSNGYYSEKVDIRVIE